MVIKVGNTDIGAHVIAGTYSVNNVPEYTEWTDANYTKHKIKLRDKVKGTFEMFFRTVSDYETFRALVEANTANTNATLMTVTVNNINEAKTSSFYIDYSLTRNRDGDWSDFFEKYKVSIEER